VQQNGHNSKKPKEKNIQNAKSYPGSVTSYDTWPENVSAFDHQELLVYGTGDAVTNVELIST